MLTNEINMLQPHPTPLLTDNEAALALAKDPHFHVRAKHINTRYHYIRKCINNSNIYLSYVITTDNVADILTLSLPRLSSTCAPSSDSAICLKFFPLKEEIFRALVFLFFP